jgi:hypothetical protein
VAEKRRTHCPLKGRFLIQGTHCINIVISIFMPELQVFEIPALFLVDPVFVPELFARTSV